MNFGQFLDSRRPAMAAAQQGSPQALNGAPNPTTQANQMARQQASMPQAPRAAALGQLTDQSRLPARAPGPMPGGYQEALMRTQAQQAQQKPIAQRFAEFQAARNAARMGLEPGAGKLGQVARPPAGIQETAKPVVPTQNLAQVAQAPALQRMATRRF